MTLFVLLFFPASGYLGPPKHCKTRENDKSTLFHPPTCTPLSITPLLNLSDDALATRVMMFRRVSI